MQPRITIVTPTYNRAGLLPETIASILAQDYTSYRYLIIDDGSSDDTEEVVRQFGHKVEYLKHANQGEAFTTSRGWALSETEYFAMVSSDDPMLSNWLTEAIAFMDENPEIIVGYPDWYIIDEKSHKKQIISALDYSEEKLIGWLHCLPGPGAIIRRSALPNLSELRRSKYGFMPDMDSWMRLALLGKFKRIPRVLATRRKHPQSTSISVRSNERAQQTIDMVEEFFSQPNLPPEISSLRTMALSRANYIAAAILGPTRPLAAFGYYRKSMRLMPHDPAGLPAEFKRKSLAKLGFVAREVFWRIRRRQIIQTQPAASSNWRVRASHRPKAVPMVSVVIPTFNRATLLPRAIKSVLDQSYENLEILVVDDGSTDNTLEVLARYSDPKLRVVEGKHGGVSNARNLGISACEGDYIAFLDSDDEFHPRKIEASLLAFEDCPDASFVHSYWLEMNDDTGTETILKPYASGDARHALAMFSPTSITTVVTPRSVVLAAGLLKPMALCEDADYLLRLSAFGPVGLIEQPHTIVHLHGAGTPRNPHLVSKNQKRAIRDMFASGPRQPGLLNEQWYIRNIERFATIGYMRSRDAKNLAASLLPLKPGG